MEKIPNYVRSVSFCVSSYAFPLWRKLDTTQQDICSGTVLFDQIQMLWDSDGREALSHFREPVFKTPPHTYSNKANIYLQYT